MMIALKSLLPSLFACGISLVAAQAPADGPVDICSKQALPSGYAITAWSATKACGTTTNIPPHNFNTLTVTPYGDKDKLEICSSKFRPQALPPDFVITGKKRTKCDDSTGDNTWTIERYKGKPMLDVCMERPLTGYAVTAWSKTKGCGFTTNIPPHNFNTLTMTPYEGKDKLEICSSKFRPQALPPDFVITGKKRTKCDDSTGDNTWTIERYKGKPALNICTDQPMPPGFLIAEQSKTKACGFTNNIHPLNTSKIVAYAGQSTLTVCSFQSVPPGFAITGKSNTKKCSARTGMNTMTLTAL